MTNATTNNLKCSTPGCDKPAKFNAAASLAYPSKYVCGEHLFAKKEVK